MGKVYGNVVIRKSNINGIFFGWVIAITMIMLAAILFGSGPVKAEEARTFDCPVLEVTSTIWYFHCTGIAFAWILATKLEESALPVGVEAMTSDANGTTVVVKPFPQPYE